MPRSPARHYPPHAMTTAPGILRSRLMDDLAVPHAFTTRVGGVSGGGPGGVSGGAFASLNFGNPMELPPGVSRDPVANIAANFALVADAIDARGREIVQVYQVHGSATKVFRAGDPSRERRPARPGEPPDDEFDFKADALVTDDPARLVAVRVADCTPVLLATHDGAVVAAVHAGWRGVVSGVLPAAIDAMLQRRSSSDPSPRSSSASSSRAASGAGIIAAIGPCIGPGAFEVGPEVVDEFRRAFAPGSLANPHSADVYELGVVRRHHDTWAVDAGKAFVDLKRALELQLQACGVERIDIMPGCTAAEPARFFSHRRDRGVTGRVIGIIGPRAS
jgi:polyphenol oxidase